jgi:hypothetical protein
MFPNLHLRRFCWTKLFKTSFLQKKSLICLPGNIKRLQNCLPAAVSSYCPGFLFENETAELVRILNREDIYKYFP